MKTFNRVIWTETETQMIMGDECAREREDKGEWAQMLSVEVRWIDIGAKDTVGKNVYKVNCNLEVMLDKRS